jgi:hypothetical protein
MVASSVATYMDVVQLSRTGVANQPDADGELEARAKVLAAVRDGANRPGRIADSAGLGRDAVLAALAWLSRNGLVDLEDQEDGDLDVKLTAAAKAALEAD